MEVLLKSLAQHSTEALLVLAVLVVAVGIALWNLGRRQRRDRDRWKQLLTGGNGEHLEKLLEDHLHERRELMMEVESLRGRVKKLEEGLSASKRHLGLIRYDAFEEVHGKQSFAVAIYDDHGNGAVLSSIVGRTDCRVYAKPLVSGRSERTLSQEEQRAIQEALSGDVKSIVSP